MAVTSNVASSVKLFALAISLATIFVSCYAVFGSTASKDKQSGRLNHVDDTYWKNLKQLNPEQAAALGKEVTKATEEFIDSLQNIYKAVMNSLTFEYAAVIMLLVGFIFVHVLSFTFQMIAEQNYHKSKIIDLVILVVGALCVTVGSILLLYVGSTVCSRENYKDVDKKFINYYYTAWLKKKAQMENKMKNHYSMFSREGGEGTEQSMSTLTVDATGKLNFLGQGSSKIGEVFTFMTNQDPRQQFSSGMPSRGMGVTNLFVNVEASVAGCKATNNSTIVIVSGVIGLFSVIVLIAAIVVVGLVKESPQQEPQSTEMEMEPPPLPPPQQVSVVTFTPKPPPVNYYPPGQVGYDTRTGSYGLRSYNTNTGPPMDSQQYAYPSA